MADTQTPAPAEPTEPELTLVMIPPGMDDPGYIERLERAMDFKEAIDNKVMTGKTIRDMVAFLADYIPGDRDLVVKALRKATQREFQALLNAVSGATAQVPPES
jgi:hypothetical protein